jgi:hypothetical protein
LLYLGKCDSLPKVSMGLIIRESGNAEPVRRNRLPARSRLESARTAAKNVVISHAEDGLRVRYVRRQDLDREMGGMRASHCGKWKL